MPRTTVAEFGVDNVGVLGADGAVDDTLAPGLDDEEHLELYRTMKLSRRLDERAIALQRRGELGTYAPAIGQEAAQVGSASALDERDWMVPSFREQAAFLARGAPPRTLLAYALGMEEGAEIRDRNDLPPSIAVGSQPLHATGIGWAQELRGEDAVALVYFGDGATSEGDFYEAMNLAGVYDAHTVFLCQNNGYAISVPRAQQTRAETLAQKAVAAGIDGIQVDGNDVLGVRAVAGAAIERAREGDPVLIEAVTYRRSMHTTADDPTVYRSSDEEGEWLARDPILRYELYLKERGVLDDGRIAEVDETIETQLAEAIETALDERERVDPVDMFDHVFAERSAYLTRQRNAFLDETDLEDSDGLGTIPATETDASGPASSADSTASDDSSASDHPSASDHSSASDDPGTGDAPQLRMIEAIREALEGELARDDGVLVYGQDVGLNGGVFRATQELLDRHPDRVFDAPVAEAGIVGMGVGLAAAGFRPVPEIQFSGFAHQAFHQLQQHVARIRSRSRSSYTCPITIRMPYGGGIKALEHHSESFESGYAQVPGLKVVVPSTPADAKGLLAASIRDPDPVVFLEPTRLYRSIRESVPEGDHVVPLGESRLVEEGADVTVVAWGSMCREAQRALSRMDASADLIDPRTVSPLDSSTIVESVRKTGRCVVVHEAPRTAGMAAEIVARIEEDALLYLEAPVERVTGYDVPFPLFAREDAYLPDVDRIRRGIERTLEF